MFSMVVPETPILIIIEYFRFCKQYQYFGTHYKSDIRVMFQVCEQGEVL